jgi:hypothetical protein
MILAYRPMQVLLVESIAHEPSNACYLVILSELLHFLGNLFGEAAVRVGCLF